MGLATHGLKFEAASLDDLADHFAKQAADAWDNAEKAKTNKSKSHYQGEWFAYDQVATMLRNTTIKGN